MTDLSQERTPVARLVLFMVCLAIAGSFIAGFHYFAIDLPQQKSILAPANSCYPSETYNCAMICAGAYCHYTAPIFGSGQPKCVDQAAYDTCVATEECHEIIPPC